MIKTNLNLINHLSSIITSIANNLDRTHIVKVSNNDYYSGYSINKRVITLNSTNEILDNEELILNLSHLIYLVSTGYEVSLPNGTNVNGYKSGSENTQTTSVYTLINNEND